ncbi:unnamed protein product, partial [Rotaria magnacalcarata]
MAAANLELFPPCLVLQDEHDNSHQHEHFRGGLTAGSYKFLRLFNLQSTKLFTCFLGIFVSYLIFGIVQESIVKGTYGK